MKKPNLWQNRLKDLAERSWDVEAIRKRLNSLRQTGFGPKDLDWNALQANRLEVLDRVQSRAEEYEYLTHSCAKGSALALMEEFGLGNWALTRAMSPFPGFGMTGGICGGVTGSLIALGLFFGSDDPCALNFRKILSSGDIWIHAPAMKTSQLLKMLRDMRSALCQPV